jgi:hypothetical protein
LQPAQDAELARRAVAVLPAIASGRRGHSLAIRTIDGGPPRSSPLAGLLFDIGFTTTPNGLVLDL